MAESWAGFVMTPPSNNDVKQEHRASVTVGLHSVHTENKCCIMYIKGVLSKARNCSNWFIQGARVNGSVD